MDTQPKATITGETEMDTLMYNMRAMNQIVAQMKEIPQLPSEEPKDRTELERVEFPEQGGVLTYMKDKPFPYKGFPFGDFVDRIDLVKKVGRATISGFYHELQKRNKLILPTLLPAVWAGKDLVRSGVYTFYRVVERFRIKPIMYCDAVREVHRAMSIASKNENEEARAFREQLRDLLCMFLEFDNAYRFRFQDIVAELDKEALAANPRKEIVRLLDLMVSRENTQEIKDSWKLVRYIVRYYMAFDRDLTDIIQKSFLRLDLGKVALTEGDQHFCSPRKDYNFGFKLNQT